MLMANGVLILFLLLNHDQRYVQISNWFINARVRLWKPMVEEMYNDEFSEDSAVSRDDGASGGASSS
jgi:hypothetical protein